MSPQVCQQGRNGGNGISNTNARMRVADSLGRKPAKAGHRELLNTTKQNALLAAYRGVTFTGVIVEQVLIITGATAWGAAFGRRYRLIGK
jgi:hypothetical protein